MGGKDEVEEQPSPADSSDDSALEHEDHTVGDEEGVVEEGDYLEELTDLFIRDIDLGGHVFEVLRNTLHTRKIF